VRHRSLPPGRAPGEGIRPRGPRSPLTVTYGQVVYIHSGQSPRGRGRGGSRAKKATDSKHCERVANALGDAVIRNFSIIAHIDHGKSTLADRILEVTGALTQREARRAVPRQDGHRARARDHDQGAERPPSLHGQGRRDLPAQPDRHARPRRLQLRGLALAAACEGAMLVVDSTQGVEAQTLANVYLALDQGLEILPVLNKVDLPSRDSTRPSSRSSRSSGSMRPSGAVQRQDGRRRARDPRGDRQAVPPPKGDPDAPLRALIFDSWYDTLPRRGGHGPRDSTAAEEGRSVRSWRPAEYEVTELGVFTPHAAALEELGPGEVGFLAANVKSVHDTKIGDTITRRRTARRPARRDRTPARLQGSEADGVRRHLPDRRRRLPRSARRAREAAA
jgi:hypothetical protein